MVLSGLLRCALDGQSYIPRLEGADQSTGRCYACIAASYFESPDTCCQSPLVRADVLERLVRERLTQLSYGPDLGISYLEDEHARSRRQGLQVELADRDGQLDELAHQRARWQEAHMRRLIDLKEFEPYRKDLAGREKDLEQERTRITARLDKAVDIDEQKRIVLTVLADEILINSRPKSSAWKASAEIPSP